MTAANRFFASMLVLIALQDSLVSTAHAADGPVVVVVKVFPAAGREDELQERSEKQLEFVKKSTPTASFRVHRSAKEPTYFLWYETFPSQSALDHHLKTVMPAFRKEIGPPAEALMARRPESETFREINK